MATFPPMWQLPFAPRSRGMTKPCSSTYWLSASKTHPAWQTKTPAKQAEPPRGPSGSAQGAQQAKNPRRGVCPPRNQGEEENRCALSLPQEMPL